MPNEATRRLSHNTQRTMNSASSTAAALSDPRIETGFQAHHYPAVNGQRGPAADATGRNDRITLEFLATYYRLNVEYQRLEEARKNRDALRRAELERECLQGIEKVLILRDSLEDRYAPLGVIADPVVKGGFTVDLKIHFGNVDAAGRRRTDVYTLTAVVPVPLSAGAKFEEVHMKIEGPGFDGAY